MDVIDTRKNDMLDFNKTFETGEILLRPIQQKDKHELKKLTEDKSLWTFFTDDLSDVDTLSRWVDEGVSQRENQTRLAFAIIEKEQGNILGSTSLGNISTSDKRIEIGWTWIGKEYQGKGVNVQSKYLLLRYCFEDLNFERVEFKTDILNLPARKSLIRIGATEEGVLRSHTLMTNNRRRDTIYYSILISEWKGVKVKNNWH